MQQVLSVGWDVGGWRGAKQAVAVIRQIDQHREWVSEPRSFSIEALHEAGGTLLSLIRFGWPDAPESVLDVYRVVLAIDAPLGFPVAFQEVITRRPPRRLVLGPEIDNPFAYRETERWVYRTFGKKPLSAPFDKLGNNATVAMYHAERWAAEAEFPIVPFHPDDGRHAIIEVYPALAKDASTGTCVSWIAPQLPGNLPDRSDELDAAICALHALAFALRDEGGDLPRLVEPPDTLPKTILATEGWIYYFPLVEDAS